MASAAARRATAAAVTADGTQATIEEVLEEILPIV